MRALILLLVALTLSGKVYRPSHPNCIPHPVAVPLVVWGIVGAESEWVVRAVSRDGHDRGLWQFRDLYDAGRGLVDPFDPVESTRLAVREFAKHLSILGSVDMALTAHRWGLAGAARHGVDAEYVSRCKGAL